MSHPDRRRAQRLTLQQPVCLVIGDNGHEVTALTENLSSTGVLVYADRLILEGSEVGLIVVIPAEMESESRRMWSFGKIVRVERELKEGKFAMAIRFQRFEALSQT